MDSDNRRETQTEPDKTKQVTLEDISGFARVAEYIVTAKPARVSACDSFAAALNNDGRQ